MEKAEEEGGGAAARRKAFRSRMFLSLSNPPPGGGSSEAGTECLSSSTTSNSSPWWGGSTSTGGGSGFYEYSNLDTTADSCLSASRLSSSGRSLDSPGRTTVDTVDEEEDRTAFRSLDRHPRAADSRRRRRPRAGDSGRGCGAMEGNEEEVEARGWLVEKRKMMIMRETGEEDGGSDSSESDDDGKEETDDDGGGDKKGPCLVDSPCTPPPLPPNFRQYSATPPPRLGCPAEDPPGGITNYVRRRVSATPPPRMGIPCPALDLGLVEKTQQPLGGPQEPRLGVPGGRRWHSTSSILMRSGADGKQPTFWKEESEGELESEDEAGMEGHKQGQGQGQGQGQQQQQQPFFPFQGGGIRNSGPPSASSSPASSSFSLPGAPPIQRSHTAPFAAAQPSPLRDSFFMDSTP